MAEATTAPPKSTGSGELVKQFMLATRDVLKMMAQVDVTIDRPTLKTDCHAKFEVSGIICFTGQVVGSVIVSFSDSAALKLVQAFAGEAIPKESPDFADAIGELANMIAGSAKKNLGVSASISTPTVVIGKGYTIAGKSSFPCLVIPCHCEFGDFSVEVSIKHT